jgi:hypothetical protein
LKKGIRFCFYASFKRFKKKERGEKERKEKEK